jgi:hypothetical protein
VYVGGYNQDTVPEEIQRAFLLQLFDDVQKFLQGYHPQPGSSTDQERWDNVGLIPEVRSMLMRWKRTVPFA